MAHATALACAPGLAAADGPEPRLVVRLSPGAAPDELRFELANEGDGPVSVLTVGTPLDPVLAEDAFEVRRTLKGWPPVERAIYAGRRYKRAAPAAKDFLELPAGGSLSSAVALGSLYGVPVAGDYAVRFTGAFEALAGRPAGRARASAATVTLVPEADPDAGRVELELRPGTVEARARPPAFNGCATREQDEIVEATAAAESIAAESLASLRDLPPPDRPTSPRYTRWFGPHSPERYSTVTERFDRIVGALAGQTIGFDCTCDETGVYAYVYPNEPYDVYLCPTFFVAATLGTDSRAGTIVHELSHFDVLGGSDDHRYGQSAAAALGVDDPELAVANADSLEYFAENTPALPMADGSGATVPPADDVPTPSPPAGAERFAPLALDARVEGSLERDRAALFRTEGADTISLASLEGDADLYVFAGPDLETDPVCTANASPEESTLDVCELPAGNVWYAVVHGYTDARYAILATAVELGGTAPGNGPGVVPDPAPGPADDDPTTVAGGGTGGSAGEGSGGGGGAGGWAWLALAGAALARRRARPPRARRRRGRPGAPAASARRR